MSRLTVQITDESGHALNGVILTGGSYNTTPANFLQGTTSGPGNAIEGTTDANGECSWNIPYTCPGQWSGTWKASGYDDLPWSMKTGNVTGNIGPGGPQTLQMVVSSLSGGSAPAGSATPTTTGNVGGNKTAGNLPDQITAGITGVSLSFTELFSELQTYWYIPVILIIVIAIAIFLIERGHKAPAEKRAVTVNPTVAAVGA